jgi:hypothetical protein
MIKKCEVCGKDMELLTVNKKGSKNFGDIIAIHKNKKFCSKDCQTKWQKNISWEDRIGIDSANKIRLDTSLRMSGNKNPTCDPEVAKKVSESLKKYLNENKEERIGEKNGFYGKIHTDEYKKWAKESRIGIISYNDEQYLKKIENQPRGENSHLWKGGISFAPYSTDFNSHLKRKIKNRDNYTCCICGKETQKLAVHHIDYDKLNSNEINLVSLCYNCHSKTNFNREKWITFFVSIIIEKYDNLTEQ